MEGKGVHGHKQLFHKEQIEVPNKLILDWAEKPKIASSW